MRKLIPLLLVLFGAFQLAGCETLKGVSKDLDRIGDNIIITDDKE